MKFEHGAFRIPDPRSFQPLHSNNMMAALDDSSLFYNRSKHLQSLPDAQGLWQPEQSFILAGFILSLPRSDPCGSEQPIHRERPVATQHSLRNCVDHMAAPSHMGHTIRCEFGLLCTFIDQPRGNDSKAFQLFQCPGVFAIAMVSFSSLKFLSSTAVRQSPPSSLRRSSRVRQPPQRYGDYIYDWTLCVLCIRRCWKIRHVSLFIYLILLRKKSLGRTVVAEAKGQTNFGVCEGFCLNFLELARKILCAAMRIFSHKNKDLFWKKVFFFKVVFLKKTRNWYSKTLLCTREEGGMQSARRADRTFRDSSYTCCQPGTLNSLLANKPLNCIINTHRLEHQSNRSSSNTSN